MQHPDAPQPSLPVEPSANTFGTRKRRALLVFGVISAAVILLLGVQSWRVVSAIVEAESAVVVPLPPSSVEFDESRTISMESVEIVYEPMIIPGNNTLYSNPEDSEAETSAAPVDDPGTPVSTANRPDRPGRLEVARALAEAGMASGDPGRSSLWEGSEYLDILLLGVDRREDGGDQNADVIMVVRLDLLQNIIRGVSIPRDLLVEIPGVGPGKINESYNHGILANPMDPVAGVSRVRDTIETNFGVTIDHYVLIDFTGFENVVDALGGVTVDIPYAIVDTEYPTSEYGTEVVVFDQGLQTLDGDQALKYVRTRHADGDDARRQRQIDVISASLASGKSLSSITKADDLILAAGDAVQTSFTLEQQLTLARMAMSFSSGNIALETIGTPIIESGWTTEGQWVYVGDIAQIGNLIQETLQGG